MFLGRLAILIALMTQASSVANEKPGYHVDCKANNFPTFDAKEKKQVDNWTADCTIKFILPDKPTRLVWADTLKLPTRSSRLDALVEVDRWMREDAPKIIDEDSKRKHK